MNHITPLIAAIALCAMTTSCKPAAKKDASLGGFLQAQGYKRIALEKNSIGHFIIRGKVNGKDAVLILDTGASGTCIDLKSAKRLGIALKAAKGGAVGYGGDSEKIKLGTAELQLGGYRKSLEVTAIDLSSVNDAYKTQGAGRIDGVIGADILVGGAAVIAYADSSLFLKE